MVRLAPADVHFAVPGPRAPQGFTYDCPSVPTMIRLGPDPSFEAKARHGIGPSPTYFKCSRGPALPWAITSVLVPSLICVLGLRSLGQRWEQVSGLRRSPL